MSRYIPFWEKDPRGHEWVKTPAGTSDEWQMDFEYHNGPRCAVCGYVFCEHCAYNKVPEPCVGKSA